ncbi:hypothetical protein EUX98_g7784 [Antrodiella citrinella]|uniref:Uncharacterized protein n=1 Tax=Antrodiella citrinella TaxID=2447956 RepID=A0A4S4MKQ5_9APHY|nr:hypothetical protein EUX98_g7784 [Antrodiella citrinella]
MPSASSSARTTNARTRKTPAVPRKAGNTATSSITISKRSRKAAKVAPSEPDSGDAGDDAYESDDDASLHSDALDEDVAPSKKRKRASPKKVSGKEKKKKSSPRQKKVNEDEDDEDDLELDEGQEVVGVVVSAPKTGRVPPGQISQNTLDFLTQLKKPECNDREWFKLNEPVYRLAEKEWKDFVETFTDILIANDPEVPHLPPKDVVHRIYNDVRFKNDKTPYKTGMSASFSRSDHVAVIPGGQSLIAAGAWHPDKNELQTIRNNLLRSSTRFRKIISDPKFVKLFGAAKPHPKGLRQNIFGMDDTLKVAPKGIDKTHKDIDLLKLPEIALKRFTDEQVLDPEFKTELGSFIEILRPFVHCINDMMTIQPSDSSSDDDVDDEVEEADEENSDDEE